MLPLYMMHTTLHIEPRFAFYRFTPEQRQWMQEMIDRGHKVNSLIAQGAKLYLGGPLTRLNCLTQQQIFNVFKKFDGKPKDIDVKVSFYSQIVESKF